MYYYLMTNQEIKSNNTMHLFFQKDLPAGSFF